MKYIFLLLLAFLTFSPAQADAVWFSSSWNYKVKVEVNPNKVGTTTAVTSFPVYVDLAGMPVSFWTNAKSDGADIRMVESDDTTETAFEIVSFATTTTKGELHFLADALGTTSTSTFYIYYGNSGASAYASTTTYGSQKVWEKYSAVYHYQEGSGSSYDSASSTQTMTNVNSVGASTTSKIGTGADFEHSSSQTFFRADSNTFDFGEDFSVTGWYKTESIPTSGTLKGIWGKDDLNTSRSWASDLYNNAGSQTVRLFVSGNAGGTNYDEFTWTKTLTTNTWFHLGFTYDISNSRATRGVLFSDAVSLGSGSVVNAGSTFSTIYNNATSTRIGNYTETRYTGYYDGLIDELRFSRQVFDNSWVLTEYNNQSSTSTFFYIGAEQAYSAGTSTPASTTSAIIWFD